MVDEIDCIVKVKDEYEVNDVVVLNVVDEVFNVKINLDVVCVWNDVRRVGNV